MTIRRDSVTLTDDSLLSQIHVTSVHSQCIQRDDLLVLHPENEHRKLLCDRNSALEGTYSTSTRNRDREIVISKGYGVIKSPEDVKAETEACPNAFTALNHELRISSPSIRDDLIKQDTMPPGLL